jgi:hypothetical protein
MTKDLIAAGVHIHVLGVSKMKTLINEPIIKLIIRKSYLRMTQKITKNFIGIEEPMVPTFGGLANIDPKVKV